MKTKKTAALLLAVLLLVTALSGAGCAEPAFYGYEDFAFEDSRIPNKNYSRKSLLSEPVSSTEDFFETIDDWCSSFVLSNLSSWGIDEEEIHVDLIHNYAVKCHHLISGYKNSTDYFRIANCEVTFAATKAPDWLTGDDGLYTIKLQPVMLSPDYYDNTLLGFVTNQEKYISGVSELAEFVRHDPAYAAATAPVITTDQQTLKINLNTSLHIDYLLHAHMPDDDTVLSLSFSNAPNFEYDNPPGDTTLRVVNFRTGEVLFEKVFENIFAQGIVTYNEPGGLLLRFSYYSNDGEDIYEQSYQAFYSTAERKITKEYSPLFAAPLADGRELWHYENTIFLIDDSVEEAEPLLTNLPYSLDELEGYTTDEEKATYNNIFQIVGSEGFVYSLYGYEEMRNTYYFDIASKRSYLIDGLSDDGPLYYLGGRGDAAFFLSEDIENEDDTVYLVTDLSGERKITAVKTLETDIMAGASGLLADTSPNGTRGALLIETDTKTSVWVYDTQTLETVYEHSYTDLPIEQVSAVCFVSDDTLALTFSGGYLLDSYLVYTGLSE